ncbi:MAG: hydroxysqualene dehydroxylase HpnE [Planctomycetaceae bacterium]|nr:hydroxysqualene dehydroxylase HpnE [Planctomycetaceae bacterium]
MTNVAIIGGGLAGLSAAAALAGRGLEIELFEAKRRLGGRAGSYLDRESGELVDHCQHVAMGCCTNYLDFCRRTGIADLFERHDTLHFFGPDGRRSDFRPSRWLPPPFHLLPSLVRIKHLTLSDKLAIARAMLRLICRPTTKRSDPIMIDWLHHQRQPRQAIERFWQVVLVSALGESLDRASLSSARKVFLDGFLAHVDACHVLVPKVSLGELYDVRVAKWLCERGVSIHLESPTRTIATGSGARLVLNTPRSSGAEFDHVILAVPWRKAVELLHPALGEQLPQLAAAADFPSAPITSVHFWFDRPITELPHAVLVGRLSQWIFRRADLQSVSSPQSVQSPTGRIENPSYYQVVISASHDLAGRPRDGVRDEVLADLRAVFPAAREASLLRWQLITEPEAVFSCRPGLDEQRPAQTTPIPNLFLAGDWTRTGWPATMEGAVRSGYLAAQAVLDRMGRPEKLVVADLSRGSMVRLLGAEQ